MLRFSRFLAAAFGGLLIHALLAQSPEAALYEAQQYRHTGNRGEALAILERAAREFPSNSLVRFNLGSLLGELGRHDEAANALRAGLELEPNHAEARLTLAKVLVQSHQYAAGLSEIDRYANLVGNLFQGFEGHYVRGLALRRLDRPAEAEKELRRAVEIDPGHVDTLFNLGALLEQAGATQEAAAYLRKAADLEPENPDIRYRLGKLLLKLGESDAGGAELAAFQQFRERAQQQSRLSVLMRQAAQHMNTGDPEQAKDLYQEVIRLDPDHAEAHANLGVAYEALGQGPSAQAMFRKATEIRPDYAEAHLNLGLKLAENEQFEDALWSISEAVRLAPDHITARQGLAMVLTRLDRPHEAISHFERIIRDHPSSAEARLNLGIALAEAARTEEALAEFDVAVRLAPDSFETHYNRGRALNDLSRMSEAREALDRATELNGQHAPSLQLLGLIERASGNDESAVDLLRRAVELDPGDPLVHYDLGVAVAQAGRLQEAIAHWEKVLSLDPRHKEAIYNLAQALQEVDPARAREYLQRFATLKTEEQDTDRAGTLWNFALAEADKKRWDRAFDLFRQALEACGDCPARGQIHKNFGLVYGHSGDYGKAAEQLSKALELHPDDEEIVRALRIVQSSGNP
ncbi:MAG: tetratricopeptide repeat protein [Bryobacterales bacterium]|nr:tetratricopeptide repeat protein [Bryobacterales bacterium]